MNNKIFLKVGDKIKIGNKCAEESCGRFSAGDIITLVEGSFEHDNGLYTEHLKEPAIWNDELHEFDSIYHLFGNDLEDFLDCEII